METEHDNSNICTLKKEVRNTLSPRCKGKLNLLQIITKGNKFSTPNVRKILHTSKVEMSTTGTCAIKETWLYVLGRLNKIKINK